MTASSALFAHPGSRVLSTLVSVLAFSGWTNAAASGVSVNGGYTYACATFWGNMACWGKGDRLGYGTTSNIGDGHAGGVKMSSLGLLPFSDTLQAIAQFSTHDHTCVLTSQGKAMCFGANDSGQLGDGTVTLRTSVNGLGYVTPPTVSVIHVSTSLTATCVIVSSGSVICFGDNSQGQLGRGDTAAPRSFAASRAIVFSDTVPAVYIGGGHLHFCGLFANNKIRCWGWNPGGQIGAGHAFSPVGLAASDMSSIPFISFSNSEPAVQLAVGYYHCCAIFTSGSIRCWGGGSDGRVGYDDGTRIIGLAASDMSTLEFVSFAAPTIPVSQVACGAALSCALFSNGRARCWGNNGGGMAGIPGGQNIGDNAGEMTSIPFLSFSDTIPGVSIEVGGNHVCMVFANSKIRCWGEAPNGETGYDSTVTLGTGSGQIGSLPYLNVFSFVLASAEPSSGALSGGELITLTGNGLFDVNTTTVKIAPLAGTCPALTVSSDIISSLYQRIFRTPLGMCGTGSYVISTSQDNTTYSNSVTFVIYDAEFNLTGYAANSLKGGTISGGNSVFLLGSNLTANPSAMCRFGNASSALTVSNSSYATCISPAVSLGTTLPLEIALNGRNFTNSGLLFAYIDVRGIILDVSSGPQPGGTPIYVRLNSTGDMGIVAGAARLKFSYTSFSAVVVASWIPDPVALGSSCFFVTTLAIPGSSGILFPATFTVSLSVDTGITWFSPTASFTYYSTPSVISTSPIGFPSETSSGLDLTILGANFIGQFPIVCALMFGAPFNTTIFAPASFDSGSGSIFATLPSSVAGMYGAPVVRISFNDQRQFTTQTVSVNFFVAMTTNPSGGLLAGNLAVQLVGAGFYATASLTCKFGTMVPTAASFVSSTAVTCLSPPATSASTVAVDVSTDGQLYTASATSRFTYYIPPVFTAVSPLGGPGSNPNNILTLYGSGIVPLGGASAPAACRFGSDVTLATVVMAGRIVCPALVAVGTVPIFVALNGVNFLASGLAFTFFDPSSLFPASGPTSGGTPIVLSGLGFLASSTSWTCRFGTVSISATLVSPVQLSCVAPSVTGPSSVQVDVSGDGLLFSRNTPTAFAYYTAPAVSSVSPVSGLVAGGTTVDVVGTGFSASSQCKFGTVASVPARFVSSTRLACTSPPSSSGTIAVEVSLNTVDFTKSGVAFTYFLMGRIDPQLGPSLGSTPVTIAGSGFVAGLAYKCRFTDTASNAVLAFTNGVFISSQQVRCSTPAAGAGTTVQVALSANDGLEYSSAAPLAAGSFQYFASPVITAVHPKSGPVAGGTSVTLVAAAFPTASTAIIQCLFDTIAVAAVNTTSTSIVCVSPPGSAVTPVRVTFNGVASGTDAVPAGQFAFFKIVSLSPEQGPASGGTVITLTGDGFVAASPLWCVFAFAQTATPLLVVPAGRSSDQSVTCAIPYQVPSQTQRSIRTLGSPPLVPGALNVSLTSDLSSFSPPTTFTVYAAPVITMLSPMSLPASGGIITLWGSGFQRVGTCRLGTDVSGNATYLNETVSLCASPPHAKQDNISLYVSNNGQQYHASNPGVTVSFLECLAGYYAVTAADPCTPCPAGQFSQAAGSNKCVPCADGFYTNSTGSSTCTRCPANSAIYSPPGDSLSKCLCVRDFYRNRTGGCDACPLGGTCAGMDTDPVAKPGYWNTANNPGFFYPCESDQACPGGSIDRCNPGYTGYMCSLCEKGYFKSGKACKVCPARIKSIIAVAIPVVVVALAIVFMLRRFIQEMTKAYAGTITIAITFFQMLAVVGKVNVRWPREVADTQKELVRLPMLDFNFAECSGKITFTQKWAFFMGFPAAVLIGLGGLALCSLAMDAVTSKYRKGMAGLRDTTASLAVLFAKLAYIPVLSAALSFFACTSHGDGQHGTLDADPSLKCKDPWWMRLLPMACACLAVYGVGIPLAFWSILHKNRKTLADPPVIKRYGSLFAAYRDSQHHFEIWVMLEKFGVAVAGTMISFAPIQMFTLQCLFTFMLVSCQDKRPYLKHEDTALNVRLRWCLMTVLGAAMMFLPDSDGTGSLHKLIVAIALGAMYGGAVIIGLSVLRNIVNTYRARRSRVAPDLTARFEKFLTPAGIQIVDRWLRSQGEAWQDSWRTLLDTIAASGSGDDGHDIAHGTSRKEPAGFSRAMSVDPAADKVVSSFSGSIWNSGAVPVVRDWILNTPAQEVAGVFAPCIVSATRAVGIHNPNHGSNHGSDDGGIDARDMDSSRVAEVLERLYPDFSHLIHQRAKAKPDMLACDSWIAGLRIMYLAEALNWEQPPAALPALQSHIDVDRSESQGSTGIRETREGREKGSKETARGSAYLENKRDERPGVEVMTGRGGNSSKGILDVMSARAIQRQTDVMINTNKLGSLREIGVHIVEHYYTTSSSDEDLQYSGSGMGRSERSD